MKRGCFAVWTATIVLSLTGCGGGGSNTSTVTNALAGTYYGNWTSSSSTNSSGTAYLTISPAGAVSGIFYYPNVGDGMTKGTVNKDSFLNATMTISSGKPSTLSGDLSLDQSGALVGNLEQTFGGNAIVGVQVDLPPYSGVQP